MKLNKTLILASTSIAALLISTSAFAQSTATETVETVVVRGKKAVADINLETGAKSKIVVDQALISKGSAGQTIIDTLNVAPGFNFTNTDAYGSSGGNLRLRGMDGSRISLTVDGVQLNDSGNYAIFTNQQLEPELICQASVNTGATDVDSMSASASGGTVNYSTCRPEKELGGVLKLTAGSFGFLNAFGRLDTGALGPWGTRAFFAYTNQDYDTWTVDAGSPGELKKVQYNARIFQDIWNNGFVSMSAHYNENRNRFYFSNTKAVIYPTTPSPTNGYNFNSAGPANVNPSNTGNVKIQSRFNFTDKLTFTFDPTFQYVLANGGGTQNIAENGAQICGTFFAPGCGIDLNGDGDKVDSVAMYNPNTTQTHRVSLTSSLIYRYNDNHTLRVGASIDRANHRQTGEAVGLNADGSPIDVFSFKESPEASLHTQDGHIYQRRNRYSQADVNVYSAEYRGRFFDDALYLSLGVRSQSMERALDQKCYSLANGSGTVLCTDQVRATTVATAEPDVSLVTFGTSTTKWFTPFKRTYTFDKVLPNLGATYRFNANNQVFVSYAESMSSPRTDSYYNVQLLNNKLTAANPEIETSTNIELGYRFTMPNFYFTGTYFAATDENRIVSSFDPDSGSFLDRNVGDVERRGFEAQVAYVPFKNLSLNGSYTYTQAELQNNLIVARVAITNAPITIATAGKMLAETPETMFTFAANYDFADKLHFNLSGKYVGERFSTDMNDDTTPAYTVWNGSVRYDLDVFKKGTYLQLNVNNLFNERYLGNITSRNNALPTLRSDGATFAASAPSFNVGSPRAISLAIRTKF